jgi:hypothetical protein
MATAVFTLSPIREIGLTESLSKDIARLNELCSINAAQAFLKLGPVDCSSFITRGAANSGVILAPADYLDLLVKIGRKLVVDNSTIVHFKHLPSYFEYNGSRDISWREIHALENLARIFNIWAANYGTASRP